MVKIFRRHVSHLASVEHYQRSQPCVIASSSKLNNENQTNLEFYPPELTESTQLQAYTVSFGFLPKKNVSFGSIQNQVYMPRLVFGQQRTNQPNWALIAGTFNEPHYQITVDRANVQCYLSNKCQLIKLYVLLKLIAFFAQSILQYSNSVPGIAFFQRLPIAKIIFLGL